MNPYAQLGGQALGQLGALGGYPALPAQPAMPPAALDPMAIPAARHATPATGTGDFAVTRGSTLGAMGGGGASAYRPPSDGRTPGLPQPQGQGATFGPSGRMARVASPDGEVREVPVEMVPQLEQLGGRRVG